MPRRPLALALLALLAGCAASPALRAARDGDSARLRSALADARSHGKLTADAARDLAEAVLAREIRTAPAPRALDVVTTARPCAKSVEDALSARAAMRDDAGAAAATALFEAGLSSRKSLAPHAAEADPAWRAAGARALIAADDGTLRRRLVADPDERVRLAALRAAADAADPADLDAVAEAARLDPNPLARTLAARAAGAIGGERAVLALRDVWALADEPLRQAIADAWGMPRALDAGGRRELLRVAESERGAPAIEAGAVLVRRGGDGSGAGLAAILRAIGDGVTRDRVLAIDSAPLENADALAAVRKASTDADAAVKLAALGRLVESSAERAAALATIAALATQGSVRALDRLATARDPRALPLAVTRAASADPRERLAAARNLVSAGDLPRAADLLADPDPSVRTGTSCAILAAPR